MNTLSKTKCLVATIGLVTGFVLSACTPEDTSVPPVFNAIDPSLQCPSGQVGWDFTTGGGQDQEVLVAPVGNEIKVQEVKYECFDGPTLVTKDLTASFRTECDNAVKCTRPILRDTEIAANTLGACSRKSLKVTYKCGNEAKLFDISSINWGTINPSGGAIVKTPANEPSEEVTFACGNIINVIGYNMRRSDGTFTTIQNDKLNGYQRGCHGTRRCFSNTPSDMGAIGLTGSTYTKYFYTCGNETAVREAVVDNTGATKNFIDFHCADGTTPTAFEKNPVIYLKSLTFIKTSGADLAPAVVESISSRLKSACETKRNCTIAMPKSEVPPDVKGAFKAEYWCGAARGFTERKYFYTADLFGRPESHNASPFVGLEEMSLGCGGRLRIADGTSPWVANECVDGSRVCSVPPGETTNTTINFFCENGGEGASTSTQLFTPTIDSRTVIDRSIECPVESSSTGIKITGLVYDGNDVNDKPQVSVFSACNGKASCLVRPHFNNNRYQYRFTCPNAPQTRSVKTMGNGVVMEYIDCKPNVIVSSVTAEGVTNGTRYSTNSNFCGDSPKPSCTIQFAPSRSYGEAIRNTSSNVSVNYQCGGGPLQTVMFPYSSFAKTSDGGFELPDGGTTFFGAINCPYDPTPRSATSTKKCIPQFCAGNQKRNATMDCVNDPQIAVLPTLNALPQWKTPQNQLTKIAKEGFPYMAYMVVAPAVTGNTAGSMWVYDVFKKKDNTGAEVRAFRCMVGSMAYSFSQNNLSAFGNTDLAQATPFSSECFKDPQYGDITSSWYQGSRRAGVMNEQVFRNEYNLVRSVVVAAFDSKGRAIAQGKNAPNPIGFFYTPATGFIDQYDFLAQTSDFSRQIGVAFVPSRQLELAATSGKLGQSQLLLDKETFKFPPVLDLDFGWTMLGDSPYHPFSDKRLVHPTNTLYPLRFKNPRVTFEMAKVDGALTNIWTPENAAVLGSYSLGTGTPLERKERYELKLPQDTVKRMMSVKGAGGFRRSDGWMKNNIEVNSDFKIRMCIEINDVPRGYLQVDDNMFQSVTQNGVEFKVGVTKRCSDEFLFSVTRDLFPKPVLPINAAENPVQNANTTAQGSSYSSSNDDVGAQQICRRQCTVNADCGAGGTCEKPPTAIGVCTELTKNAQCKSGFRKGMVTGGKAFGLSVMSVSSSSDTDAPGPVTRGADQISSSKNNVNLMSFNVLDSEEKKQGELIAGGTKRVNSFSLGRAWSSVQQIAKALSELEKKNPSPVKKWYKPSFASPFKGGATGKAVPGLAFGIGIEKYVPAGPIFLYVEVAFQASLSFDVALKFTSDEQTIATKTDQAQYGCLGTTQCLKLSTEAKTFVQANEDCNLQGGRLAEPRSAAKLAALKTAASGNDIWIGAQASHIFDDLSCIDLSPTTEAEKVERLAGCKNVSTSRYHWINGNVAFSDNTVAGTGYNNHLYADGGVQGFGTISTIANNGSPLRSALLMKTTGSLENHAITDKLSASSSISTNVPVKTARYVCEFDPAAQYTASEVTIGPILEASVGVSASGCWPSGVIGACLSAELKFITIGVGIEYGSNSIKIFDQASTIAAEPRATIGASGSTAKWEWSALSGRVFIEIRYFIGSKDFNIVSFSGVAGGGGDLWTNAERFRRNKQ